MRAQKRFLPFLYLFIASLFPFLLFVLVVDPNSKFELFGTVILPTVFLFVFLFISFFFLFSFIFASTRRGALASLFIIGVLALRFFGLKSIYHALLLLAIILLIEFLNSKRK